jgi:hypothetical protein
VNRKLQYVAVISGSTPLATTDPVHTAGGIDPMEAQYAWDVYDGCHVSLPNHKTIVF